MKRDYINTLISMADRFDQQGKFKLAEEIDNMMQSRAARPKAPLKDMNDDVKNSLMVFLVDAEDAMGKGCSGLNELFRRMRYFNIDDSVKDLGLDKVMKDMEKTQTQLDNAKKNFYVMTFGKKPSKEDLKELKKSLKGNDEDEEKDDGQKALDFFESDLAYAIDSPEVNLEKDVEEEHEDNTDVNEEEFQSFMGSLNAEDDPEDMSEEEIQDKSEDILMDLAQNLGVDVEQLTNALENVESLDSDELAEELLKQKQ